MDKISRIVKREDGYHVLSEDGKNLGGPYRSRSRAVERLQQVEYFKHKGSDDREPHEFSSTQVQLSEEDAETLFAIGYTIPDSSICEEEGGREDDAHITVKFGLHTDNPQEVDAAIAGFGPIKAKLTRVGSFTNPKNDYDVLKFDVESEDLNELNAMVSKSLEATDTHPTYHPHATIAYLKKGEAKKYVHGTEWAKHAEALMCGREITFDTVMFSNKVREKTPVNLGKESASAIIMPASKKIVAATSGVYIGVSGFNYKSWNGVFYPSSMPGKKRLEYYASKFPTLEISSTYYQMPEHRVLAGWDAKTPPGFIFSFRAPKQVTHINHLIDCGSTMNAFMSRLSILQDKLGVVTFQIQESLPYDGKVLAAFLASLPSGFRYSMEFRSEPWYNEECYALLAKHKVAMVTVSHSNKGIHAHQPSGWGYFRMSGHNPDYKQNFYSQADLQNWRGIIADSAKPAFVYFNNEYAAYSAKNAASLMDLMGISVEGGGYISPVSDGPSNPVTGPNNGPGTSGVDPENEYYDGRDVKDDDVDQKDPRRPSKPMPANNFPFQPQIGRP